MITRILVYTHYFDKCKKEIKPNAIEDIPLDKPSILSIIFMELITPVIHKIVKGNEINIGNDPINFIS